MVLLWIQKQIDQKIQALRVFFWKGILEIPSIIIIDLYLMWRMTLAFKNQYIVLRSKIIHYNPKKEETGNGRLKNSRSES